VIRPDKYRVVLIANHIRFLAKQKPNMSLNLKLFPGDFFMKTIHRLQFTSRHFTDKLSLLLLTGAFFFFSLSGAAGVQAQSIHLTMGNPSGAVTSTSYPSNYLMSKYQYALSYHRDRGIPNWVSWHLASSWLGSTPRQDDFRPDTTLPSGWYRVAPTDYSGSGYDRGHMCPSGDRTTTVANNSATFLMTNMIPQAPDNNQRTWANLESYCRTLASQGNELYIISGGYGSKGTIAGGRVSVPSYTWKVIMVLPYGTNDVARVNSSTRTIAVLVPNNNGISSDWRSFRQSVDYIESITGYNFFSAVSTSIQSTIESRVDNQ